MGMCEVLFVLVEMRPDLCGLPREFLLSRVLFFSSWASIGV